MDGLRKFIKVEIHCALDVGHLRKCARLFEVRRPKFKEECPEASIREGPEELTLRAEDVGSQKASIHVDHTAEDRWRRPLVDADWHAFCQAIYKGSEGSEWEDLYERHNVLSEAAGVRKPNESKKAKAFWKMKAAKDSGDDFYHPERKDNVLGISGTRLELWEEHLKDPIVALDNALKCVENQYQGWLLARDFLWNWSSMTCVRECSGMVNKLLWESVWLYLDPRDSVRLRTASTHWNVPGKYGPHGELFFFLLTKEPTVFSELVEFGPVSHPKQWKHVLLLVRTWWLEKMPFGRPVTLLLI